MSLDSLRPRRAAGVLALAALAACGDDPAAPAAPLSFLASPSAIACTAGQSVTLGVTVSAPGAPHLTFRAQDAGIVVTGSDAGATIACARPGTSAVLFTATSGERTVSGTVPVTIAAAPALAVSANPAVLTCFAGQTVPLAVAVDGGAGAALTYTASNANVAVTGSGATASVRCATVGSATITAAAASGVRNGTVDVPVVISAPPALAVTLDAAELRCVVGQTVTVRATAAGQVGDAATLAFAASNGNVAVTVYGAMAAVRCASPGTANVVVTATSGAQTGTATVAVTVATASLDVTLAPAALSCRPGETVALKTTVGGATGAVTLSYTASSASVVVTPTATGATVVCATPGQATISVTAMAGAQSGGATATATVSSAAASVTLTPSAVSLAPGGSATLTASVALAADAPAGTSRGVVLASSDTTVARVTPGPNGTATVTAALGAAVGAKATITATSVASPTTKATTTVTIVAPGSLVRSVSVIPAKVSIGVGDGQGTIVDVTLAASAPAGTSRDVTFAVANSAVASVDADGTITGRAVGATTVTVHSVADPSVTTPIAVAVIENPTPVPLPVRVTIQGIFQLDDVTGAPAPADPSNARGTLRVDANLASGPNYVDSLVATLGTLRVVCQRAIGTTARGGDVEPKSCDLPTTRLDAVTGAPELVNGPAQLQVVAFYRLGTPPSGATASQSATVVRLLNVANTSGYKLQVANTPTAAQVANGGTGQATGPQGVPWRAGSITVTATPVSFQGPLAAPQIVLVDANGGVATQTASAAGNGTFVATFPGATAPYTATPAGNTLNGYSSPLAGAPNGGTTVQLNGPVATVMGTNGLPTANPVLFIDNAAPEARGQYVSANYLIAASQGFLGGGFVFADSVYQATAVTPLADNNGVDRVARTFYFAPNAGGTTGSAIVASGTAVTAGAGIPQNASATAYVAAAKLVDALGNAAAVPISAGFAGPTLTFGVLTTPPSVFLSGLPDSTLVGPSYLPPFATINLAASSNSGAPFPQNFGVGTLRVQNGAGTFCATPSDLNGGVLRGVASTRQTPPCPTLAFNGVQIDPNATVQGTYTLTVEARDVAGNLSLPKARTFVIDRTPPTATNLVAATAPLTGGQPETVTASGGDNAGLVSQLALAWFPTMNPLSPIPIPEVVLRYDGSPLGTAFAAPFTTSASLGVTIPSFVRSIAAPPATSPTTYVGATNLSFVWVNGLAVGTSDLAANWRYAANTGPAVTNLLDQSPQQAVPTLLGGTGPQSLSLTFRSNLAGSATTGGFVSTLAGAGGGVPSSLTINLVQNGVPNTPFAGAFSRVELWVRGAVPGDTQGVNPFAPAGTAYRLSSACSAPTVSISATASTITNACTVAGGTGLIPAFPGSGTTPIDLLVLATTANGHAVAFVIPTITLTP